MFAAAVLPGVAATLLSTFSRGAMGVAAIGLLAYCLLTRFSTLPTALLAIAPPAAIALRSAWDATALATNHPTSPLAVSQGHHVAVVVGACMLARGLLRAVLLLADRRDRQARRSCASRRAGRCALALRGRRRRRDRRRDSRLRSARGGFAHREYDKFVQGTHGRQGARPANG